MFAEFLSLYYVLLKTTHIFESDCQPVVLNDELMELNHCECRYTGKIELIGQPYILPSRCLLINLEKKIPPFSDKMRLNLRNKHSDLQVTIID